MTPQPLGADAISLGKPKGWDETTMGPCGALEVVVVVDPDTGPEFRSLWKPDEAELHRLVCGGFVRLSIVGVMHPPCMLEVVDCP